MRTFLVMLMSSFITLCFADDHLEYDILIDRKVPEVGETLEVYLGDPMFSQVRGEWKQCVTPLKNFEGRLLASKFRVLANRPICKEKREHRRFKADYINYARDTTYREISLVTWKSKGNKSRLCQTDFGLNGVCVKNIREGEVIEGDVFIPNPNEFTRTIEYAGKSGQILKFIFSEFRESLNRKTMDIEKQENKREFEINLEEGNVVAYQGAVLEVLESSGAIIKYKVIRSFRS